jgi:hypothetical protein
MSLYICALGEVQPKILRQGKFKGVNFVVKNWINL